MLVAVPSAAFIKMQIDRWVDEREAAQGIVSPEEPPVA
jgi:hypothetical protein